MPATLRIALAQINPHVGAVQDNLARLRQARARRTRCGADLVVTPEFSIAGYPPEDLVRKPAFVDRLRGGARALAADTADRRPGADCRRPVARRRAHATTPPSCWTAARIAARRAKHELPNYGVFDEKRVFDRRPLPRRRCRSAASASA